MRGRGRRGAALASALLAAGALALLVTAGAERVNAERSQYGSLVVSLDGGISPLRLPRQRPAPVTVRLAGALRTTDEALLPRVTRIEFGLPGQGVLTTRGLPSCPRRRLQDTRPATALAACRPALVGRGKIEADVILPSQRPFRIKARLLAFNGRVGGRRAVLLHAYAPRPPTVAIIPFAIRRGSGRFGTVLSAELPPWLGPWPHFAAFDLELGRRFRFRGRQRSYLSASCPIPRRFTVGFFSFARSTYTLANGRRVSTAIARSCRAR